MVPDRQGLRIDDLKSLPCVNVSASGLWKSCGNRPTLAHFCARRHELAMRLHLLFGLGDGSTQFLLEPVNPRQEFPQAVDVGRKGQELIAHGV